MDKISFTINGEPYSLSGTDVDPDTSLNDFLRHQAGLAGTKAMCHEGGCGVCIVTVSATHPATKEQTVFSANSCLVHILSCHGWDITTIEGVGNRMDGYHVIQSRLASFNGTQCGYCTPGWVMSLYSLQKSGKQLTTKEVENSFAGNICRCTGYRPILDAFKTFASDVKEDLKDKIQDLEDLHEIKCLKKKLSRSSLEPDWCVLNDDIETQLVLNVRGSKWFKAFKIQDVFNIFKITGTSDYRLVNGNTGRGVFPTMTDARNLIDISSISSLRDSSTDANLILGAGMSLNEVMDTLKHWAAKSEDFKYLEQFYNHLDLVAHVPVRNIGTIGGNLALKNLHKDFPSDVFVLLSTVKATLTIMDNTLTKTEVQIEEYLNMDLKGKLILNVKLPPLSANHIIRTYKIMPRAQNAHAIVNAGLLFKMDENNKTESCNIGYGNISPNFVWAKETEKALRGLELFKNETLQMALKSLDQEILPIENLPDPTPYCRKMIALGLFYKTLLNFAPAEQCSARYKSGGEVFDRPVSRGTQTFDTDKSLWPLNKPIPKLEALAQCAGEAVYADDKIPSKREVHVALVVSTVCRADIDTIDTHEVLKIPGVVAVFTAKDIPGKNTFTPTNVPWQLFDEEILASKTVSHYGQPIALVAATSRNLALKVAKLVKVTYKNVSKSKPVVNIRDALTAPDAKDRIRQEVEIKPTNRGVDITKVIKGSLTVPSQYHYYMETQTCRASVSENGLSMTVATQWMDLVHVAVAQMLGIKENEVNITVNRIGGGYGGKATRSSLIACCCALVAYKLNRESRLVLSLPDNMQAIGKRQEFLAEYEVGTDDNGLIQYLEMTYYSDCGISFNDSAGGAIAGVATGLYNPERWHVLGNSVCTDTASTTWCRAPGTTEAHAIVDRIMEHIAFATRKDPTGIKILNLLPSHDPLKEMVLSFKTETNFQSRKNEINKYNSENAWKKKSIKLSLINFPLEYSGNFCATVSVYHGDGTVALSHAGIEMGQGIHTKVAQVCAYTLKIPLEKVSVKPSNNMISPNAMASNGSVTSDLVAFATLKACQDLLDRLQVAREVLTDPTWEEVVKKAYDMGVNLQSSYMYGAQDDLRGYSIYGVTVAEVELDVLTGQHQVLRVDLIEDTGQSISPEIDVGQIEGAFVMGLGLWTSEQLIHDPATGRLLTDRTWTYKPPGAKDIPIDFRVSFRRNSPNPTGVLRSKATGEPALLMAVAVAHAIHEAIMEARREHGYQDTEWLHVDTPYCVDNIIRAIQPKAESYKLK